MTSSQLYPLEINPVTTEPFLRLRNHKNIVLTPPRTDDVAHLLQPMNDERVGIWLGSAPYPYSLEDGESWISIVKEKSDSLLEELESARGDSRPRFIDGCPVRHLREIKEDGSELFIGDIGILRCGYGEIMGPNGIDWDGKAAFEEVNNNRLVGDPEIVWSIGDFLIGSHHGRGIMTDAVGTLLQDWAVPRMNCHKIVVSTFAGNEGSIRVFEKNGFEIKKRVEEYGTVKGVRRGLVVLEWNRDAVGSLVQHQSI